MERVHAGGRMAAVVMIAAVMGCVACASGWAYGQPRSFGGFAAPETHELPGPPRSVVVADFDGDGVPDIAVGHRDDRNIPAPYRQDRISVFLGRGDGTFELHRMFVFSGEVDPVSMAAGDLDGSGDQDLVVSASAERKVYVLRGHGDGTVTVRETHEIEQIGHVGLGDLNGNGVLDLIVTRFGTSPAVLVLLGNGDGTFTLHTSFDFAPTILSPPVLADLNGNGIVDIAMAVSLPSAGRAVSVHLGNGDGTFGPPETFEVSGTPVWLAVGDLRGVGIQDFVVAATSEGVGVLLGRGDGTFEPEQLYDAGEAWNVSIDDLDGDGVPDLVVTNPFVDTVSVLLGRGDGTFSPRQTFDGGVRPSPLVTSDFTLNGLPDVVVGNSDFREPGLSVLLNQTEPCIADWNGDGEVDANDFFAYLDDFAAGKPRADLNNDGEIDINDFFIFLEEFEEGC